MVPRQWRSKVGVALAFPEIRRSSRQFFSGSRGSGVGAKVRGFANDETKMMVVMAQQTEVGVERYGIQSDG